MKAAMTIALTALMTLTMGRADAQHWFPEIDLREPGEVVWETMVEGDLDRDVPVRQYQLALLPTAFTGPGYRFEVEYEMTRTKDVWPYWDAVARIDAPAADGQVWGRTKAEMFKGTVSGSWSFCGEAHESARPHRVRFTFNQPASFPYKFRATIRARRVPSANIGGALRERPEWVRVGTAASPSWISGDIHMKITTHRWLLVSLEPGQQLRVKSRPGAISAGHGATIGVTTWSLDHDLLSTMNIFLFDNATQDALLRTNTTAERQWYILGLKVGSTVKSMELGFYSPQGASPPVGQTVTPPSAAQLDPYAVVARDVLQKSGPSGVAYEMPLPGTGEMIRLYVRSQKTPWMGAGTGAGVRCQVYAQDGTLLKDVLTASDAYGLDNAESFIEIDRSTDAAKVPVRAVLTTIYAAHVLTADATRYRRLR